MTVAETLAPPRASDPTSVSEIAPEARGDWEWLLDLGEAPNQRFVCRHRASGKLLLAEINGETVHQVGSVVDPCRPVAEAVNILLGLQRAATAPGVVQRLALALIALVHEGHELCCVQSLDPDASTEPPVSQGAGGAFLGRA